jgi:hypothetical protein
MHWCVSFAFYEVKPKLSSTGGDGSEMEKRVNPMPAKGSRSFLTGQIEQTKSGEAMV